MTSCPQVTSVKLQIKQELIPTLLNIVGIIYYLMLMSYYLRIIQGEVDGWKQHETYAEGEEEETF